MISSHRSMTDLGNEAAAAKAIRHVLTRIREHSACGWYLGAGTESFALLTEALAMLDGAEVREVREDYLPIEPRDPEENDDAPKAGVFDDEDRAIINEIANFHEEQSASLTNASARAVKLEAFNLLQQAAKHARWGDEIRMLGAKGGGR